MIVYLYQLLLILKSEDNESPDFWHVVEILQFLKIFLKDVWRAFA